jgi:hypothetical protein
MAEDGALAAYFQVDLGPNPAQQLVERVQVAFKLHDSLSTFSSVQPLPKVIHECAQVGMPMSTFPVCFLINCFRP